MWSRANDVFEYLPIAAVVGKKILCIHGGLGNSIETLEDLRGIPKPIRVSGDLTAEAQTSRREKVRPLSISSFRVRNLVAILLQTAKCP